MNTLRLVALLAVLPLPILVAPNRVDTTSVQAPAVSAQAPGAAAPAASPAATQAAAKTETRTLVTRGSTCRYLNGPTPSARTNWRVQSYDDRTWSTGTAPFGHNKAVNTDIGVPAQRSYFRCPFTVPAGATVNRIVIEGTVDDGAIFFLNGTEFGRYNVTGSSGNATSRATQPDPHNGTYRMRWYPRPSLAASGDNMLSVQLYSADVKARTPDAVMDPQVTVTWSVPAADPPTPPGIKTASAPPGWRLYWADEFTGSSVDETRWRRYSGNYGHGDRFMLHCLVPENATVSGGTLKLQAARERRNCPQGGWMDYTSGFLGSRDTGTYYPAFARFEFRARTPHGQGMFPALWLRHRNGAGTAEVDVFEMFHATAPGTATQTLHFPTSYGTNTAKQTTFIETPTRGRGGWHTYAVEITRIDPDRTDVAQFRFLVDDVPTLTFVNTKARAWAPSDPMAPTWDIALQLWIGGQWTGHPDQKLGFYQANGGVCAKNDRRPANGDPKNCPTDGLHFAPWNDSIFEVDYVRVYVPS